MEEQTTQSTEASTADQSVAASLGLNAQLFVSQLINFALVFSVLWFLILRPLTKKMEERRLMINDSLDKAKEIETNLMMSEQKYQEKLDEAKVEANKVLESASKEANELGNKMKVKAKDDIQFLIDQAKRNIQTERDEAMTAVRDEAVNTIFAVLEKILPAKMTNENDKKAIEEALKGLQK